MKEASNQDSGLILDRHYPCTCGRLFRIRCTVSLCGARMSIQLHEQSFSVRLFMPRAKDSRNRLERLQNHGTAMRTFSLTASRCINSHNAVPPFLALQTLPTPSSFLTSIRHHTKYASPNQSLSLPKLSSTFPRTIPATILATVSSGTPSSTTTFRKTRIETIVPTMPSETSAFSALRTSVDEGAMSLLYSSISPAPTFPYGEEVGYEAKSSIAAKRIHITLSTAPCLNKSNTLPKDALCEICLENTQDGQKILKTSCCRLLAHCECLSKWALTKIRAPELERLSFTCPKCRTAMDLAKFRRGVPSTAIDEPRALPSCDIDVTFSLSPQPQYNPWSILPPRPGHLEDSDELSNETPIPLPYGLRWLRGDIYRSWLDLFDAEVWQSRRDE